LNWPSWVSRHASCERSHAVPKTLELLGQSAHGAQYGLAGVHFYWIGAVPAMVFLGLVMMPFYYGSKVRNVGESDRFASQPGAEPLEST
jgi:hypothetical protein